MKRENLPRANAIDNTLNEYNSLLRGLKMADELEFHAGFGENAYGKVWIKLRSGRLGDAAIACRELIKDAIQAEIKELEAEMETL